MSRSHRHTVFLAGNVALEVGERGGAHWRCSRRWRLRCCWRRRRVGSASGLGFTCVSSLCGISVRAGVIGRRRLTNGGPCEVVGRGGKLRRDQGRRIDHARVVAKLHIEWTRDGCGTGSADPRKPSGT